MLRAGGIVVVLLAAANPSHARLSPGPDAFEPNPCSELITQIDAVDVRVDRSIEVDELVIDARGYSWRFGSWNAQLVLTALPADGVPIYDMVLCQPGSEEPLKTPWPVTATHRALFSSMPSQIVVQSATNSVIVAVPRSPVPLWAPDLRFDFLVSKRLSEETWYWPPATLTLRTFLRDRKNRSVVRSMTGETVEEQRGPVTRWLPDDFSPYR